MKYIRTKDGIIDLSKVTIGENGWKDIEEYIAFKQEEQKELIKQADTIEDLCDEFVLDHPLFANNCKCLYHSFEKAKNGIKKRSGDAHDLYDFVIYGAIWTDKGLIYVVKMNNKEELELL